MTADIKDCFLATPMHKPEYMKVHYKNIPDDIKFKYNLHEKVTYNNYVCIKIKKDVYNLK